MNALLVAAVVLGVVVAWAAGYLAGAADAWRRYGPRCPRCHGDARGECNRRGQCVFDQ